MSWFWCASYVTRKIWACILCHFSFYFSSYSFLLYFTKALVCDKLKILKKLSFTTDSLISAVFETYPVYAGWYLGYVRGPTQWPKQGAKGTGMEGMSQGQVMSNCYGSCSLNQGGKGRGDFKSSDVQVQEDSHLWSIIKVL